MSSLAVPDRNGQPIMGDQLAEPIRARIRQGREHRKQFEANWALNLAFAAGDHWTTWDNEQRTLRRVQDVDSRYRNRELYTADVITEYRTTALGELGADNDRPQLLLARADEQSEDFEKQLNRGVGYGWEYEWKGDRSLAEVDRYLLDMGTAVVRCRYDATVGKIKADNVPHIDGKPILQMEQAVQAVAGAAEQGQTLTYEPIKEGRICWEPISALGLIVPPGVTHEDKFPWECVVRPAYLPDVKEQYGALANDLTEDHDIRSDLGLSTTGAGETGWGTGQSRQTRLRDHVWLFSYYERPSQRYPKGRVMTLAGNQMKLVAYDEQLDYVAPDGTYRSGLAYFHWWRVTGRFWSRSLIDVMRDPQRMINKRRTQTNEIIDRGMPYVFVQENSKANQRVGLPMEMIELAKDERPPVPVQGIGPGTWMQADVEALREDLDHATGISGARRGENPPGVTTYSQLAMLSETDQTKRNPTRADRQQSIGQLIQDSIYDMRAYWGEDKEIALAGEDGKVEAEVFNATKIPTFFIVSIGKGAPPRTQAAKLQLITDIYTQSIAAAQPLPIKWFKESLEAGEPLELPAQMGEDPAEKAELENHVMTSEKTPLPIAYYDQHAVHLPIHRKAQDDAMFSADMELWHLIEAHCQLHVQAAQAQQQAVMDQAQQQQALSAGAQQNQQQNQLAQQPQPTGGQ